MRKRLPKKIYRVYWDEYDMSRTDDPDKVSVHHKVYTCFTAKALKGHVDYLDRHLKMHQRWRPENPDFVQNVEVLEADLAWKDFFEGDENAARSSGQ